MKSIKFLALPALLALMFAFTGISSAQKNDFCNKSPEEIAGKKAVNMKTNLSLSDDQYKQVYNLILQNVTEMKSSMPDFKSMDKDTRMKMRAQHREEMQKQLEGILTPDQMTKFKENMSRKFQKKQNKQRNNY